MDIARPRPFAAATGLDAVVGICTDIDDTLTHGGAIEPVALQALAALRRAGMPVFAVTGRPLGWSRPFARDWPLDAIVAENGAVALVPGADGSVAVHYQQDAATRAANARRLAQAAARVLREVPGAVPARDSDGRETDIAIDHSEFAHLDAAAIARVVDVLQAEGLNASVSSIHVNGWIGSHDKLTGAQWIARRLYGHELDLGRWVYVGDSTNDQAMFAAFAHSVGVANLQRFAGQLRVWPAYLTSGERGAGFAEVAHAVLAVR